MYFKNCLKKVIFIIFIATYTGCTIKENKLASPPVVPDSLAMNEGIALISKAIESEPDNAELYYQRAQNYFNLKYLGMADADINYALTLDSTNALFWYTSARINYALNQTKKAAAFYQKAITLKPNYTEAKLKLADLYYLVKEHQLSINILQELKKTDSQNSIIYHMLGLNYKETGDTVKAMYYFQSAIENNQEDYESMLYLANLYAAKLNPLAFEYYKSAIKIKPSNTDAYFARALLAQKLKQYKQALADYKIVIDRQPNNEKCYYNVGYINFETDKLDEALRNFNICTRMNADFTEAYYMKGLIYEMQRNFSDAKINYNYALNLNPNYKLAAEGLQRIAE